MSERFTIVVTPPGGPDGTLSVEHAMRQVLDTLDLLVRSGDQPIEAVDWRIVRASASSPLVIESEAHSRDPHIDAAAAASAQKQGFRSNWAQLSRGTVPPAWDDPRGRTVARGLLERSTNGVFQTTIEFDAHTRIDVDRAAAARALESLVDPSTPTYEPRVQPGSIEAVLLHVGTYRNRPAIRAKERLTGTEIWCHVSDALRSEIDREASFDDVWGGKRFVIRGLLEYDAAGLLSRIQVAELEPIAPRSLAIGELSDPDFTGGLEAVEYLRRFREGELE